MQNFEPVLRNLHCPSEVYKRSFQVLHPFCGVCVCVAVPPAAMGE